MPESCLVTTALLSRHAAAILTICLVFLVTGCGSESSAVRGPRPRVVIEEPLHQFDMMSLGEERQHIFLVQNTGDAPLTLTKGNESCACMTIRFSKPEVAPGGTEEITVTWRPKIPRDPFSEDLEFVTNDPDTPKVALKLRGRVQRMVEIEPERWELGTIGTEKGAEFVGSIWSKTQEFDVLGLDCSHSQMSAESIVLTEEDLEKRGARAGYRIRVRVPPLSQPPGAVRESLTIRTNINRGAAYKVDLTGLWPGPFEITGQHWNPQVYCAEFDQFPAAEGKSTRLQFSVTGVKEEFRFLEVKSDDDAVEVSLDRSQEPSETRQFFTMTIRVKPGSTPSSHTGSTASKVRIRTNHPQTPELAFKVEYVAD
jgi:hypothetical protein